MSAPHRVVSRTVFSAPSHASALTLVVAALALTAGVTSIGSSASADASEPAPGLTAAVSALDGTTAGSAGCGSMRAGALTHLQVSPDHDLTRQVLTGARTDRELAVAETWPAHTDAPAAVVADDAADWVEVDKVAFRHVLSAGSRSTVRFLRDGHGLRVVPPPDGLTDSSRQAVGKAPTWMSEVLADNLRRMSPEDQDTFAALILNAEDPMVDEVAFQVARVAPASLAHELFTPKLIVDNAAMMYEHDQKLSYVDIVDHSSAESGGDYYSTTAYRVAAADGTTSWVEIPRDVYYWWVLHPKLSDETVKQSAEASDRQATYGHFWREYLWLDPHPLHSYATGNQWAERYSVLGEILARPTVFWDGVRHNSLPKGRPFTDEDTALDTIGNWVSKVLPKKAQGNRPVQPNQIAYEHNGNCGEIQDLLGAAARTGLVPVLLTSNPCEDHVWNEFYWATDAADWHPYQVSWDGGPTHIDNPGIAYDKDHGGSKDLSGVWAWRGDGYVFDVVERYSNTATLETSVVDADYHAIDGARVMLFSEAWGGDGYNVAALAFTDSDGKARFTLGENQNYYVRVETSIGNYPPEDNRITRTVGEAEVGEHYSRQVRIGGGTVPQRQFTVAEIEGNRYKVSVRVNVPQEIVYGRNLFGESADFAKWEDGGTVTLYSLDQRALAYMSFGQPFEAALAASGVVSGTTNVPLPDMGGDWFVVLANERQVNAQVVEAEVTLMQNRAYEVPVAYLPLVARNLALGAPTTE